MFDSPEAYHDVCDRDDFEVDPSDVLVLRYAGPKGYFLRVRRGHAVGRDSH